MTSVVLGGERRDAIADAAIHLIATRGLRGLTHRAVDAEVGLPPGSTSYYLRTRQALLTACLDRLMVLDEAAMLPVTSERPAFGASIADELVGVVIAIARDRPESQVARYELAHEATRNPELWVVLDRHARRLRTALAQLLHHLGIPDAQQAAWPVAAMLDGVLRDRVAGLSGTLSEADYEASVRRCVAALLSGLAIDAGSESELSAGPLVPVTDAGGFPSEPLAGLSTDVTW